MTVYTLEKFSVYTPNSQRVNTDQSKRVYTVQSVYTVYTPVKGLNQLVYTLLDRCIHRTQRWPAAVSAPCTNSWG